MTAYYNENDAFNVAWLRELIKDGLIEDGEIDDRDIRDVRAADLYGFTQVHLFAGIGGWSYALRLAGWPSDSPVWTGSCPCQPFSAAGKRRGFADERHLWPEMRRLVAECSPPVVFGEQVASKDGRLWLAGVRADLEALGYAVGAADLCAAGVGAPHIRQRLYWVADAGRERSAGWRNIRDVEQASIGDESARWKRQRVWDTADDSGTVGWVADAERNAGEPRWPTVEPRESDGAPGTGPCVQPRRRSDTCGVGNANGQGSQGRSIDTGEHTNKRTAWSSGEFIPCADGKARRVEPAVQSVVDGLPARMGRRSREDFLAQIETEIGRATSSESRAREALSDVQCALEQEIFQQSLRGSDDLSEAAFLFSIVRELAREGRSFSKGVPQPSTQVSEGGVRILRLAEEFTRASCGRGLVEQRPEEPANTVRELPQILAWAARQARAEVLKANAENNPLAYGVPNRVGTLRGAGNAIVAPLGKTFIEACREAMHEM